MVERVPIDAATLKPWSPARLAGVTGANFSAPGLTADNRMFADTVRNYRQAMRLSKAVGAPYLAPIRTVLPVFLFPAFP